MGHFHPTKAIFSTYLNNSHGNQLESIHYSDGLNVVCTHIAVSYGENCSSIIVGGFGGGGGGGVRFFWCSLTFYMSGYSYSYSYSFMLMK